MLTTRTISAWCANKTESKVGHEAQNKNMKTRTIILAAIALMCASMPAAENGTGKIVVYYSGSLMSGAHQTEDVYLVTSDGHQEVQLHANRYHEFVITPGRHTLIAHHLMSQDAIEV